MSKPIPEKNYAEDAARHAIRAYLHGEPKGFANFRQRFERAQQLLREEAIETIHPRLMLGMGYAPDSKYEDKKLFAELLNQQLRQDGRAIRCPHTDRPPMLAVDPGDNPTIGQYRLYYKDEHGAERTTLTSAELPAFSAMVDPAVPPPARSRRGRSR